MKAIKQIILLVLFTTPNISSADDQLGLIMPYDFAGYTDKEKQIYISGVIDGQIFMLYNSLHPDLKVYLDCAKKEGPDLITRASESRILLGDDAKYPMPWAISSAMGLICSKYRGK